MQHMWQSVNKSLLKHNFILSNNETLGALDQKTEGGRGQAHLFCIFLSFLNCRKSKTRSTLKPWMDFPSLPLLRRSRQTAEGWEGKQAMGACGLSQAKFRNPHLSVWLARDGHGEANSSRLNADDTEQHLELPLCDPWNQSHFCASLTHHNHEVRAQPQKPNLIGITKFPLLAIIAFTVAADIYSAICQPSLIEWAFTSYICFPLGCTSPILVSVSPLIPLYIIEGLWPVTGIRKG